MESRTGRTARDGGEKMKKQGIWDVIANLGVMVAITVAMVI